MSLPEGDHCLRCKHHAACVLPQKLEGRVCGWYNAAVDRFVRRERAKHRVTDARLTSGSAYGASPGPPDATRRPGG